MKAVILAGGTGSHLAPYTTVLPKPLMPMGNRTILEILMSQLRLFGCEEVTLALGYHAHIVEAVIEDGRRLGLQVSYSLEDRPLGTCGPLSLPREGSLRLTEPIMKRYDRWNGRSPYQISI
jgi:NDP-mannose synthase